MERITTKNVEKEIENLLDHGAFSFCNLEKFNTLCKAMKNLSRMNREFTEEAAQEWVACMEPPARWTLEQTSAVMQQRGYAHKPYVFWAVMNAVASDYGRTMAKHGIDKAELWADLAHDWLCDADAEPDKAGRYWRDIVKH